MERLNRKDMATNEKQKELESAVASNSLDLVKMLLVSNANINHRYDSGSVSYKSNSYTVLKVAVDNSLVDMTRLLIENKADISGTCDDMNLLMRSTSKGCGELVKLFVELNMDINDTKLYRSDRVILTAIEYDQPEMVKLLIELKADVSSLPYKNVDRSKMNSYQIERLYNTPLCFAAKQGKWNMLKFLVDQGIEDIFNDDYFNALRQAFTRNENVDVLNMLIELKADINKIDEKNNNLLIKASEYGHTSLVEKVLTENLFDVNCFNNDGTTPLIAAYMNGHVDLARYLVNVKANVNQVDKDGESALIKLVSVDHQVQSVCDLIEARADVDLQSNHGITALMAAAVASEPDDSLLVLLKSHANPNIQDKHGNTAVNLSIIRNSPDFVFQHLIDYKADIHLANTNGHTPLYNAVNLGLISRVESLITQLNADVNVVATNGETMIFKAVQQNKPELVMILLKAKANPYVVSKRKITPLMIAINMKYDNIMNMLLASYAEC